MTISQLKIDGSIVKQELTNADVTPHWQTPGHEGHRSVRLMGSTRARWLDIDTLEMGEKSSKRTMVVLDEDEVRALRDLCNTVLGE